MKGVFLDFDTVSAGDIDIARLDSVLPNLVRHGVTPVELIIERIGDAGVVLTNKIALTREIIEAASELKLIALAATGYNNVDINAAKERGVGVCNIRNYCTASVVEHVFTLILALNRYLDGYQRLLAEGKWRGSPQFCLLDFPIAELDGTVLGIVGFGELGRAVAGAGECFGMDVRVAQMPDRPANGGRVPLQQLLGEVDVLSLHCPLTRSTERLIDADALARMKPTALLINTARGAIVDEAALAHALRNGDLGGAGIDVLSEEPPVHGNPLLEPGIPNLIVTPHVAWASRAARQRAVDEMAENVKAFLDGERRNRVV